MRLLTVLFLCTIMAACTHVPSDLLITCPVHEKTDETLEEAVRLANDRLDSIKTCNERILKIKNIVEK